MKKTLWVLLVWSVTVAGLSAMESNTAYTGRVNSANAIYDSARNSKYPLQTQTAITKLSQTYTKTPTRGPSATPTQKISPTSSPTPTPVKP